MVPTYIQELRAEEDQYCPLEDYADYDLARQLEALQSLVRSVNDRVLEQPRPHDPKQVRWWNRSLTYECKLVIRLRGDIALSEEGVLKLRSDNARMNCN